MRPYMLWLTRAYVRTFYPAGSWPKKDKSVLEDWISYQSQWRFAYVHRPHFWPERGLSALTRRVRSYTASESQHRADVLLAARYRARGAVQGGR